MFGKIDKINEIRSQLMLTRSILYAQLILITSSIVCVCLCHDVETKSCLVAMEQVH